MTYVQVSRQKTVFEQSFAGGNLGNSEFDGSNAFGDRSILDLSYTLFGQDEDENDDVPVDYDYNYQALGRLSINESSCLNSKSFDQTKESAPRNKNLLIMPILCGVELDN